MNSFAFVAARAAFRCHGAADRYLVLDWVSFVLLAHLLPRLERAVPCRGEVVEAGCEAQVRVQFVPPRRGPISSMTH